MALEKFAILFLQICVLSLQYFIVLRCDELLLNVELAIEMSSKLRLCRIIFLCVGLPVIRVVVIAIEVQLLLQMSDEYLLMQHGFFVPTQLFFKPCISFDK